MDLLLDFKKFGNNVETFNRISAISSNKKTLTLEGVATVANVCDGTTTSEAKEVAFALGVTKVKNEENAFLYAKLAHENVENVDLAKNKFNNLSTGCLENQQMLMEH